MDNYTVRLYPRARRDIEDVYSYIAKNLSEPTVAEGMIIAFENAIYSLEQMPERQTGIYANRGYRQLFVKNYIIIYRVLKKEKEVHIVTVRYARVIFNKKRTERNLCLFSVLRVLRALSFYLSLFLYFYFYFNFYFDFI